jgi:hypothetical protein
MAGPRPGGGRFSWEGLFSPGQRARENWALIKPLWDEGLTASQIAQRTGLTTDEVTSTVHRMGQSNFKPPSVMPPDPGLPPARRRPPPDDLEPFSPPPSGDVVPFRPRNPKDPSGWGGGGSASAIAAASGAGLGLALTGDPAEASPFSSLRQEASRPLSAEDMAPLEVDDDEGFLDRVFAPFNREIGAALQDPGGYLLDAPERAAARAPGRLGLDAAADVIDDWSPAMAEGFRRAPGSMEDVALGQFDLAKIDPVDYAAEWGVFPARLAGDAIRATGDEDFRFPVVEQRGNLYQDMIDQAGGRTGVDTILDLAGLPLLGMGRGALRGLRRPPAETGPPSPAIRDIGPRETTPLERSDYYARAMTDPDFGAYHGNRPPDPLSDRNPPAGWDDYVQFERSPQPPQVRDLPGDIEPIMTLGPREAELAAEVDRTNRMADYAAAIPMKRADPVRFPERAARQQEQLRDIEGLRAAAARPLAAEDLRDFRLTIQENVGPTWSAHGGGEPGQPYRDQGLYPYSAARPRELGARLRDAARPTPEEQRAIDWAAGRWEPPIGRDPGAESIPWDPRIMTPNRWGAAGLAGATALGAVAAQQLAPDEDIARTTIGDWPPLPPPPPPPPPPPAPDIFGAQPRVEEGMMLKGPSGFLVDLQNSPDGMWIMEGLRPDGGLGGWGEDPTTEGSALGAEITPDPNIYRAFELDPTDRGHVRRVQNELAALGFDPGKSDGVLGENTQAAIDRLAATFGKPPGADLNDAHRMAVAFRQGPASLFEAQAGLVDWMENQDQPNTLKWSDHPSGIDNDYGSRTENALEAYTGVDWPAHDGPGPDQEWLDWVVFGLMRGNPAYRRQPPRR